MKYRSQSDYDGSFAARHIEHGRRAWAGLLASPPPKILLNPFGGTQRIFSSCFCVKAASAELDRARTLRPSLRRRAPPLSSPWFVPDGTICALTLTLPVGPPGQLYQILCIESRRWCLGPFAAVTRSHGNVGRPACSSYIITWLFSLYTSFSYNNTTADKAV